MQPPRVDDSMVGMAHHVARHAAMPRHRSSAAPLAWLYAALIVYASLSPFTGWKQPVNLPLLGFGHMPWQPYWTGFDVASNLVGYVPLGALLFGAQVRSGRAVGGSALNTVVAGALLSLCMESLQNWLPGRVPSMADWMLNGGGTVLGVLLAMAVRAMGGVDRWQAVRDRWFVHRSAGGIALLLLWPLGLLFPPAVPFGLGQGVLRLREVAARWLEDTPWEAWVAAGTTADGLLTPLSRGSEWLAIVLGMLAPSFIAFSIMRAGWRRFAQLPAALTVGLAATTLSTAMNFGPQHAWAWITPTVVPALVAAGVLTTGLALMPPRGVAAIGLVSLTVLVALVNQAPQDPYYAESLQAWEQGRFIRFHGLAQWVGWLWPFAGLVYLLVRVVARDEAS